MRNILLNCFYDGMTLSKSIEFCERCFSEKPSEKVIETVKNEIKKCTGKDWE